MEQFTSKEAAKAKEALSGIAPELLMLNQKLRTLCSAMNGIIVRRRSRFDYSPSREYGEVFEHNGVFEDCLDYLLKFNDRTENACKAIERILSGRMPKPKELEMSRLMVRVSTYEILQGRLEQLEVDIGAITLTTIALPKTMARQEAVDCEQFIEKTLIPALNEHETERLFDEAYPMPNN